MSNLVELIGLLIGALLPPFIDLVNARSKSSKVKYWFSVLVCLVCGGLFNLGKLNLNNFLETGAIVFIAAQTVYRTYWKSSDPRKGWKKYLK